MKGIKEALYEIYDKKYKLLLIVPFTILLLSLAQIGHQINKTGYFLSDAHLVKSLTFSTVPHSRLVYII